MHRDGRLLVTADGRQLYAFESKATILALRYAFYMFVGDTDHKWLQEHGETIPADPGDARSTLESADFLITSDPVLYVLAYEHWLAQNGFPKPENVPLPIPTRDEALQRVRSWPSSPADK